MTPPYVDPSEKTCRELGIRHTRTKPRHAWTHGFVERLQGAILHEHWRVEFRRRYFTHLPQLQRSRDGFLRFYNHARPHHGYRTPATLRLRSRGQMGQRASSSGQAGGDVTTEC